MPMPPKQSVSKIGEYSLATKFRGYHAREDPTTLPVGTLITPSQNVVIKESGRVSLVDGYTLDGAASLVIDSGILSHFDFINFKGDVRNLRAGFLTSAANDGKLQYRYVDALDVVNWVDLKTSLTNVRLSYCEYWDNSALVKLCTWVDGSNNVYQWNGAVTTFASGTTNKTISFVGNSASLTAFGTTTGTSSFIQGNNGSIGTSLLAYVGLTAQPTNGQTLVLSVNATSISIQFVSIIGAVAGNVLIGANLSATMTNLLGLLQAPGTTSATQVALSGGDQTKVGYITYASNNNTVTKEGTNTWAQEGFSTTGSIVVGGVSYTYAGGGYSTTLFGISADISATAVAAIVHQSVITTALSSMTSILSTFGPTVIGCGKTNQIYLGSSKSNSLYISKNNAFTDFSFSTPRIAGDGALKVLQAPPTKFVPQESNLGIDTYDMYISQGLSAWSVIRLTVQMTAGQPTNEQLDVLTLKVAPLQGALSERLVCKMKNNIVFVGNDKVANFLGYISYQFVPAIIDFSFPIIDDMNGYDFTDASVFYHKNYIYVSVPQHGLVRMYNMTDQTKQYTSFVRDFEDVTDQPWFWEAPITYPVSGFYVTPDKGLCAHSYTTSESYQVFTSGSLNGQQIDANATFAFDDKGDRTQSKASDECWVEGYIAQNTVLNVGITGDLDSFATQQVTTIDGSDNTIVAFGAGAHSLGKNNLGSQPLGGAVIQASDPPAWFHVAKTYVESPFYLEQVSFWTKGIDLAWELICWGTNAKFTNEGNNEITQ